MKTARFFRSDIGRILSGAVLFAFALALDAFAPKIAPVFYILALLVSALDIYIDAVKGIIRRDLLDEKFLMSIASIGAMIIGEWSEGVAVMLFFLVGEAFEHRAVKKSRAKIRSLMDICPDTATVLKDGEESVIDADDVEIGDTLVIKPGERVAVDVEILSGSADIDTSALTGESVPRSVSAGDVIESGCIVLNGVLICSAKKEASESAAMRILDMVENATERKSKEENYRPYAKPKRNAFTLWYQCS